MNVKYLLSVAFDFGNEIRSYALNFPKPITTSRKPTASRKFNTVPELTYINF
jgi:hypothetical protein